MSNLQKIWLGVSLVFFIGFEVLWGNLIKILNISFLPIYKDVQLFTDKPRYAFLIIFIEILSILSCFYLFNIKKDSRYLRYAINIILLVILLTLIFSLYVSYIMSNISFPG